MPIPLRRIRQSTPRRASSDRVTCHCRSDAGPTEVAGRRHPWAEFSARPGTRRSTPPNNWRRPPHTARRRRSGVEGQHHAVVIVRSARTEQGRQQQCCRAEQSRPQFLLLSRPRSLVLHSRPPRAARRRSRYGWPTHHTSALLPEKGPISLSGKRSREASTTSPTCT